MTFRTNSVILNEWELRLQCNVLKWSRKDPAYTQQSIRYFYFLFVCADTAKRIEFLLGMETLGMHGTLCEMEFPTWAYPMDSM